MALLCLPACLIGPGIAVAQSTQAATYLEFGTVLSIGQRSIEVRIQDARLGRPVERSFLLSRDTRADLVHTGETVEVIYSVDSSGALSLDRLIALHGEQPKLGPAPSPVPSQPAPELTARRTLEPASPPPVIARTTPAPARPAATTPAPKKSKTRHVAAPGSQAGTSGRAPSTTRASTAPAPPATVPSGRSVNLGSSAQAQVPALVQVPLGGSARVVNPSAPRVTAIVQQPIGELCNRTQSWSAQPITLAVLDFRYPTEKEEARDIAQVGGGSGTALADEVYNQLSDDPHFALSRGDREKLFRMDFAGAARLGRQLGVDAVLLGTFVPVDTPNPDPDFPQPTQAYTLRAGIVETCTGELLYKLQSSTCSNDVSCPGSEITAKQAANPKAYAAEFALPLANLLAPVLQNGVPAGLKGNAGSVTEARGDNITLRITPGASLRAGDQVGVHASRLAKIPSTNTLHVFRNELIGRVTIQRVAGQYAYGTFAGEPAPLPGDIADLITE